MVQKPCTCFFDLQLSNGEDNCLIREVILPNKIWAWAYDIFLFSSYKTNMLIQ